MWQINIVNAKVQARHGIYAEEKTLGQSFEVNISIDFEAENIEHLQQTIDYVQVYNIMLEEMEQPTPLLEQVVERIANRLKIEVVLMHHLRICIKKLNPLFAKQLEATEVCYSWQK
jgi:7,8-dihydroneopterin aldolase/epimerase/oxygenase